jgi:hypothetical protein
MPNYTNSSSVSRYFYLTLANVVDRIFTPFYVLCPFCAQPVPTYPVFVTQSHSN